MKRNKYGGLVLELSGCNYEKFYDQLLIHNVKVFDIVKPEPTKLRFFVHKKNYKKILLIAKNLSYDVELLSTSIYSNNKNIFVTNLGFMIGILISIISLILFSQFTFHINIIGLENLTENDFINVLYENDIKIGYINKQTNEEIEKILSDNIDKISLVSVNKIGTALVINVKEKLPDLKEEFLPIKASNYMVIKSIKVFSGYSKWKIGDYVKKGDVLVEPFMVDSNGNKIDIKPVADIVADVWYTNSYVFYKSQIELIRSGNRIVNQSLLLFDKPILCYNKKVDFEKYEVENKTRIISSVIPIQQSQEIYYELVEKEIIRDWEKEKDDVINLVYCETCDMMNMGSVIEDEKIIITECENKNIISVYLKSTYVMKVN